ncbi:MAG: DUF5596 domain-containing protein [Clostridia bacterium]|nr:DUF5596 domain-containing protein [Clostridia bacterium]
MKSTKNIIEKWYRKLGFSERYDEEFYSLLKTADIPEKLTLADCDIKKEACADNLFAFLYLCEDVENRYRELGIPEEILLDTLRDIVVWCDTWSGIKGELALGQLDWLSHHIGMKLFKLGRLQFYLGKLKEGIAEIGTMAGDEVLDIHIPAVGKLDIEECKRSLELAKQFFPKYFPDFNFKCFVCHSWLLDDTLKKYLPKNSNIIRFGDMFTKTAVDDSNALIRYMFEWDTTVDNLPSRTPKSAAAAKIKEAILSGEQFHVTLGWIAL